MSRRLSRILPNRVGAVAFVLLLACGVAGAEEAAEEVAEEAAGASEAIQPGDTLKIAVYREPDLSGDFAVDPNGAISYPLVGTLKVAGRDPEPIGADIARALKKFIIDPQVTVTHEKKKTEGGGGAAAGARAVTILGEVRNPGSYETDGDVTLTKILARAGGLTPVAEASKVKIIRKVKEQQAVALFDLERINNAETEDPVVKPGDKIVVPQEEKDTNAVAVLGEVKNAGMYEVTPGFTLMRLIAKAGGFTPLAATNKVRVVREKDGKKEVSIYNAGLIIGGQADDPELKPGDMIFVPETFF
jgi:polysaccharide export outer membrane protein